MTHPRPSDPSSSVEQAYSELSAEMSAEGAAGGGGWLSWGSSVLFGSGSNATEAAVTEGEDGDTLFIGY